MPTPRARTWAPPIAVAAAGAAVPAALSAASLLPWPDAVLLTAVWAVAVGVAVLLAAVRRALHRLGALARLGALEQGLARVEAELPVLREQTRALGDRLEDAHRDGVDRVTGHVTAQGRRDYAQAAAWQELRDFVRPGPFMPALRDWAASPDVLCLLVDRIRRHTPALVVECGSGASSVWLGYALRRVGTGRLVALEHDERYAALSRDLVAAHGLDDIVEVRTAPLKDWAPEDGGTAQPWYDLDALADLADIDLVFVDGPPARTAPEARYPAGPVLLPRCAPGAAVLLDDTIRAAERRTSDRWLAAHPDFERTVEATEKGTHVLTRR
ncbi:putative O-methyltransferase YrrM [Murinocardiopsis flavida]|uniref:Putative O-methyltransferase YrrM n=1 Tax=Murinocardiopsis flavida TaxID=645275 RepID=A0A2P8DGT0_9ACTN|nr:class I SAM-dependent methyltransferase [Murinocardiopsis flavida]PSK96411.1 putative O-methyltransferase YrrM [Murinocardiopsis flavida]